MQKIIKIFSYSLSLLMIVLITSCTSPSVVVAPPPISAPQTKGQPVPLGSYITDTTTSGQSSGTPPSTSDQSGAESQTTTTKPLTPPQKTSSQNINIALLAPLSGPLKNIGKSMLQGAQAAVFTFKDKHINLMPFDTKGTPSGASDAMDKAISYDAHVIIGPLLASSTEAIQSTATSHNLSIITLSNSSNIQNNNTFVAGMTLDEQANNLVEFERQKNIQTMAIIAPDTLYGHVSATSLQNAADQYGVNVTTTQFFNPDDHDFSDMIKNISNYDDRKKALDQALKLAKAQNDTAKIKSLSAVDTLGTLPYQAVVIAATRKPTLQIMASQLAYYDSGEPNIQILGLQTWSSFPNLEKEPSLIGAHFVTQPLATATQFNNTYQAIYGVPPTHHAALAYDITSLIITISQHSTLDPQDMFSPSQLMSMPQGFQGIEGIFRFAAGGRVERRFAIARIYSDGIRIIKKAETCFLCR